MAPTYAIFSSNWKIEWSEFDSLSAKDIEKYFVTTYMNVPLLWRIMFTTRRDEIRADEFGIRIKYLDGPVMAIKDIFLTLVLKNPDGNFLETWNYSAVGPKYKTERGKGWCWFEVGPRNSAEFQATYKLKDTEPLEFIFTLKMPITVFSINPFFTKPEPCSNVLRQMFQDLEDPDKSIGWNAKLTSRDDQPFYCHHVLLVRQSKVLAAMFRHQPIENGKPYQFPGLGTDSMKSFLEFIYTSKTQVMDLSTAAIMELADAAEQYDFQRLKKSCASALWKRAAKEREDCFCIIRFADLMGDMKHLKYRAMDVLVENWNELTKDYTTQELRNRFGIGDDGERLREEFDSFVFKPRLVAHIGK